MTSKKEEIKKTMEILLQNESYPQLLREELACDFKCDECDITRSECISRFVRVVIQILDLIKYHNSKINFISNAILGTIIENEEQYEEAMDAQECDMKRLEEEIEKVNSDCDENSGSNRMFI